MDEWDEERLLNDNKLLAKNLEEVLRRIERTLRLHYQEIERFKSFLSHLDSSEFQDEWILDTDIKKDALEILHNRGMTALEQIEEFNAPIFAENFSRCLKNRRGIRIEGRGNGRFFIEIDLNKSCGRLETYARAVDKVRKDLKISKYREKPVSPEQRSYFWAKYLYGPARQGKDIGNTYYRTLKSRVRKRYSYKKNPAKYINAYWETIRRRVALFDGKAPFWELIDKGNTKVGKFKPSYGGTAYPIYGPTRFVLGATDEITAHVESSFYSTVNRLSFDCYNRLKYLQDLVDRLEARKKYIEENFFSEETEIAIGVLKEWLGESEKFLSENKLRLVAQEIYSGTSRKRIYLGIDPSGREIRVRTIKLAQEMQGRISDLTGE
jgi:hypothetical protein